MDQKPDPRKILAVMHQRVIGDLLNLIDGFYSNIEEALFELAFRNKDEDQQRRCFDLMRELRYRRSNLIEMFAKHMHGGLKGWFSHDFEPEVEEDPEFTRLAASMAKKCSAHFTTLLQNIAERAAYGTCLYMDRANLPIGPFQIAYNFVVSCRTLEFDEQAIEIVQELFGRFVLDRMGGVYGDCNRCLEQAGYFTRRELDLASIA
ncbi:MAG: DUF1631 family protein [Gammaproteobacteria bacterium]|nr:DUF1631 family protein [Gammaproteobacteria bacterium]